MLPRVVAIHSKKPSRDIAPRFDNADFGGPAGRRLTLLGRGPFTVGAWRRTAHEHLSPVEVLHEDTDAHGLAALGPVPEEFYLRSDRKARLRDAVPEEIAGWAALDPPVGDRAVLAFDVDPNPGVWIDQLHFRDRALQVDRPVLVKRSEERRVGKECRSRWSADVLNKNNSS